MSLTLHLAPVFDLPIIESTFHAPKWRPDSWLDVAAPTGSSLAALSPSDRRYVGSQTVLGTEALHRPAPLLEQPTQHVGYGFEQFVLHENGESWRWNTAQVEGRARTLFQLPGL